MASHLLLATVAAVPAHAPMTPELAPRRVRTDGHDGDSARAMHHVGALVDAEADSDRECIENLLVRSAFTQHLQRDGMCWGVVPGAVSGAQIVMRDKTRRSSLAPCTVLRAVDSNRQQSPSVAYEVLKPDGSTVLAECGQITLASSPLQLSRQGLVLPGCTVRIHAGDANHEMRGVVTGAHPAAVVGAQQRSLPWYKVRADDGTVHELRAAQFELATTGERELTPEEHLRYLHAQPGAQQHEAGSCRAHANGRDDTPTHTHTEAQASTGGEALPDAGEHAAHDAKRRKAAATDDELALSVSSAACAVVSATCAAFVSKEQHNTTAASNDNPVPTPVTISTDHPEMTVPLLVRLACALVPPAASALLSLRCPTSTELPGLDFLQSSVSWLREADPTVARADARDQDRLRCVAALIGVHSVGGKRGWTPEQSVRLLIARRLAVGTQQLSKLTLDSKSQHACKKQLQRLKRAFADPPVPLLVVQLRGVLDVLPGAATWATHTFFNDEESSVAAVARSMLREQREQHSRAHRPGARVVLCGLQVSRQFNGCAGIVDHYQAGTSVPRYAVRIADVPMLLCVRAANLSAAATRNHGCGEAPPHHHRHRSVMRARAQDAEPPFPGREHDASRPALPLTYEWQRLPLPTELLSSWSLPPSAQVSGGAAGRAGGAWARIPPSWHLCIPAERMVHMGAGVLEEASEAAPRAHAFNLMDVAAATTVGEISTVVARHLRASYHRAVEAQRDGCRRPECCRVRPPTAAHGAPCCAEAREPAQPHTPATDAVHEVRLATLNRSGDGSVLGASVLDAGSTAEAADLFNRQADLVVISLPRGGGSSGLERALQRASTSAANTRPRAPEHTGMLNNLLGGTTEYAEETNLSGINGASKRRMRAHLKEIDEVPSRVCYMCGMVGYKAELPAHNASEISRLEDCRAYTVFRHYLRKKARELEQHGITEEQMMLCKPHSGGGCTVYACSACRSSRREPQKYFDLFDGVDATGQHAPNGIGQEPDKRLDALTCDERCALGVLKMCDATFKAYSGGAGYTHFTGGGTLTPSDFSGLAGLMHRRSDGIQVNRHRMRAALALLRRSNAHVRHALTCFERSARGGAGDRFPQAAGGASSIPFTVLEEGATLGADDGDRGGVAMGLAGARVHSLHTPAIGGILQAVDTIDSDALLASNALEHQTAGTVRSRARPGPIPAGSGARVAGAGGDRHAPAQAMSAESSAYNLVHTALFHTGEGGYFQKEDSTNCSLKHWHKKTLGSVNPRARGCEEFMYHCYQDLIKRQFHACNGRFVTADVANNTHEAALTEQARRAARQLEHLRSHAPGVDNLVTPVEAVTGSVPRTMVGSKKYWQDCYAGLMALAMMAVHVLAAVLIVSILAQVLPAPC